MLYNTIEVHVYFQFTILSTIAPVESSTIDVVSDTSWTSVLLGFALAMAFILAIYWL